MKSDCGRVVFFTGAGHSVIRAIGILAAGCALLLLGCLSTGRADESGDVRFFENEIRPLLVEQCLKCHGSRKSEGGLRLDQRPAMFRGGDSGPAVVAGKPAESLVIKAVRHEEGLAMPPQGKLTQAQIAALERWIAAGAVWPTNVKLGDSSPQLRSGAISREEREFWSFQPLRSPEIPSVSRARLVHNEIDRFIHVQLEAHGLAMSGAVEPLTLLRRATFDLTGLPPTAEEIADFLDDNGPEAFSRVVDRLLASRAYAERWGRHWLDIVRYADTAGETADYPAPLAYKYRNWVIDAIAADLPYDEFVRQQIAGDVTARELIASWGEIPSDDQLDRYRNLLTATGFIAISRRFGFDVENYHHLTIQDTIDTIGQSVLGLSLGCARCHDHKYDPVNMTDYYGWYGIFESSRYSFPGSEEKKRPYDSFPILALRLAAERQAQFDQRVSKLDADLKQAESELKAIPEGESAETRAALKQRKDSLASEMNALKATGPFAAEEVVYGVVDRDQPADARLQFRGEKSRAGDVVPRRNLEILGHDSLAQPAGSGRRDLADWLTRPTNPLTARVAVNRIWQHHFGRGIVSTSNDFGTRGQRPTHPELLDWLALRLIDSGWSLKTMHRLIMASAAYQQAGSVDASAIDRDPENRLFGRFARRRLSAEEIRDAMLAVSGGLDLSPGGPHPFPPAATWGFSQHSPYYGVYPSNHRSVYLMQQRLKRHPFLGLFDGADGNVSTPLRELTTVPTQALFLMNNEFVHRCAAALAQRSLKDPAPASTILNDWFLATLGRPVSTEELAEAELFIQDYDLLLAESPGAPPGIGERRQASWAAYARTLLTRNEFLHVD